MFSEKHKMGGFSKRKHEKESKAPWDSSRLLTGMWWEGWSWPAQTIVPSLSSPPWWRSRLLHIGTETGRQAPLAPVCPGFVRTPTLQGWTPKVLQRWRKTESQAACLTVHLPVCTPAGFPLCPLWCLTRQLWLTASFRPRVLLFFYCLPSLSGCPHCKSILSEALHLASSACLSASISLSGDTLLWLLSPFLPLSSFPLWPLLSTSDTFTVSAPLCLSVFDIYLLLCVTLSPYLL